MKERVYIFYKESLFQSVLADLFTFGLMMFSFWFNYRYIDGSRFVYGVLLVMFVLFSFSRVTNRGNRFTDKKKMIEYIEKNID